MKRTKVYQLLSGLSAWDRRRLRHFLQSPYFNKNPLWVRYLDFVEGVLKGGGSEPPSKEELWAHLHPDRPYDDAAMRKMNNHFIQLILKFFATERFMESSLEQVYGAAKYLAQRELHGMYGTVSRLADRLARQHFYRNSEYSLYRYRLNSVLFRHRMNMDTKRVDPVEYSERLDNIMTQLDYFYLSEKLRYFGILLTLEKMYKREGEILFMEEVLDYVRTHDFLAEPSIALYYQVILLLKEPENDDNYYRYKQLLHQYIDVFPHEEQKELYEHLINYSIRRLNAGEERFLEEVFHNYQLGLEREFLYIKGKISPFLFKNIVTAGLRMREFEWVRHFIEHFSKFLPDDIRDSAVAYNRANLHFYLKEYDEVLKLLQEVNIQDIYYSLGAKTLLMATYYELEEWDVLDSFLHAFRTFVDRHRELSHQRQRAYLKLIRYTRQLLNSWNREELRVLYERVQGDAFPSKGWLITKLEERLGRPRSTMTRAVG